MIAPTTYEQSLLSLDPLAYWPLNEASGTIAHDVVGNYNGSYVGGCTLAQTGPGNTIFGSPSRSVLFDGTSGYVNIPEGPFDITGAITAVAWVDVSSVPNFAGLFGHGDDSWRMSVSSSGAPGASDGNAVDATSGGSILDGNWHMIAYSYSGIPGNGNGLLYVDGMLAAVNNVTAAPAGDTLSVWIGGSPDYGTTRLLNARIAHAAVYSKALSSTQLEDLYTGTYAGAVNLSVSYSGASAVLTWQSGVLLQAPALSGPWTTNTTALSPYTVPATAANEFFRVLVNP